MSEFKNKLGIKYLTMKNYSAIFFSLNILK